MDQQLHSNPPATPYHTHSLLQINTPNLGSNPKQTFQWSAQIHNDQASEFRFIFRSEEINKNNKMEYHCNPLDYGYSIVGRVLGEERSKKNVLHQTIFGPIGAQPQIFKYFSNPQKEKANILLNKIQIQAQVKIITCPFVINNNYKASIAIKTQNFNFELKIEKEVRLPPHSPFFKFYAREENAIGLSFYHQQAQFMNKLRQLNIFVHSGFYLKLFFISRQFRDAFLFQLMQYFGLIQSQTSPNQLYVPRANTRRDRSRRTSNISGYSDNRKGLDEKVVNQLDDQLFKLLYNGQDQQKRLSFSFTDAQFLLSSVRKSGIQRIQNAQTMKQLGQRDDKGTKQRYMTENKLRDEYKQLQQATRNEYQKRRSSNNLLKQHKFLNRESHFGERNHQNMSKELELRTTISKLVNQIDNLLKQNRRLSRENKKIKEQNMKLRFREIKKTFKQTFKQKKNNFNRQSGLDLNPENVTKRGTQSNGMQNLHSSGGSLMKNLQNMPRDSGNNLKISSFGPKQKTIESPGSNGTSQLSSNYNIEDRKKLQSNFASMISVSNKQFLKQKSGRSSKFIPKGNTRGKSFGNKNRSINSRSQTDNSFQRPNETPSTPFFSSVTPHEAFSVKAYQSHFFQQYLSPKKER